MLHLQSLGCLVTLVWYLLLQGRGGVTEQDAVLAGHMLHLGWQALETLLTLLARVALLGKEHFRNMIFFQVSYVIFRNKSHIYQIMYCQVQSHFIKHFQLSKIVTIC